MRTKLIFVMAVLCVAQLAVADCTRLEEKKQTAITSYVHRRLKVPKNINLVLKSVSADSNCYRKLTFESGSPKHDFVLYLSPDQRFLMPAVLDTTVDPEIAERIESARVEKLVTSGESPTFGNADAKVTIVEFGDFECPYCQRIASVLRDYVSEPGNNARLVFRNFVIPMHPWARTAASAAICADTARNGEFWKAHDFLFENQSTFTPANIQDRLTAFLKEEGNVDLAKFNECMRNHLPEDIISRDAELASEVGVQGTPTLFVNGRKLTGVLTLHQLDEAVKIAVTERN